MLRATLLDELGYLPFARSGGRLLFHRMSKLYEMTSVIITTQSGVRRMADRAR
jgi:DNA replication protein DnaC